MAIFSSPKSVAAGYEGGAYSKSRIPASARNSMSITICTFP